MYASSLFKMKNSANNQPQQLLMICMGQNYIIIDELTFLNR